MFTTSLNAGFAPSVRSRGMDAARIVLCSLLIALCAQISLPLPFSPVPMTLQTLAVIAVGAMLGSRQGAFSVMAYLAESVAGLPVLAGGTINPLALIGPRGGYLLGFVVLAYIAGWCVENRKRIGALGLPAGIAAACVLQLAIGAVWLAQFIGMGNAIALGVVPFIPGELIKVMVAMAFIARNESSLRT